MDKKRSKSEQPFNDVSVKSHFIIVSESLLPQKTPVIIILC